MEQCYKQLLTAGYLVQQHTSHTIGIIEETIVQDVYKRNLPPYGLIVVAARLFGCFGCFCKWQSLVHYFRFFVGFDFKESNKPTLFLFFVRISLTLIAFSANSSYLVMARFS